MGNQAQLDQGESSPEGTDTPVDSAESDALSLQEIYQKCIGSVVSITTSTSSGKASGTATVTVKATYSPTWAEEPIEATANVSVRTLPSICTGDAGDNG